MTDTTTEAVERLAELAASFHATKQPKIEAGDNYKSAVFKMGFRSGYVSAVAAIQTPDPVINVISLQPTRTYEDGLRDAANYCQYVADEAKSCGMSQMTKGALTCRNAILYIIKEKSHE